ncbi:MAG: hypothetical protein LBN19_00370 [Endomicrobium sp.]|jgi:hypothetical protein|nr:hypothetical protein [Endomicrobium sp.]
MNEKEMDQVFLDFLKTCGKLGDWWIINDISKYKQACGFEDDDKTFEKLKKQCDERNLTMQEYLAIAPTWRRKISYNKTIQKRGQECINTISLK